MQVALGYERIVYGDHGPYLELSNTQVKSGILLSKKCLLVNVYK